MQALDVETMQRLTARVHAHSKRPRMAFVLALLLFDRADNRGLVETTRIELSAALRKLVGDRGYDTRRQARRNRIEPLLEEWQQVLGMAHQALDTAQKEGFNGSMTASLFGAVIGDMDASIGDPTGQNISRVMTELETAGVIAWRSYIDRNGEIYDKPARGRTYYLQLSDWLLPRDETGEDKAD